MNSAVMDLYYIKIDSFLCFADATGEREREDVRPANV